MARRKRASRSFLRDNGLSLTLFGLFGVIMVGQVATGWHHHNQEQAEHGQPPKDLPAYLAQGDFVEATMENWESEFLQMAILALLTAFLYQRGSSESKDPDATEEVDLDPREHRDKGSPKTVRRGGAALVVYENSLVIALAALFAASFALHAWGGTLHYSAQQVEHGGAAVGVGGYLLTSRFWFESFQNWQSEFLSVGVLVVLSIWLRQRGSPQSKPVHAPHGETGG